MSWVLPDLSPNYPLSNNRRPLRLADFFQMVPESSSLPFSGGASQEQITRSSGWAEGPSLSTDKSTYHSHESYWRSSGRPGNLQRSSAALSLQLAYPGERAKRMPTCYLSVGYRPKTGI